MKLEYIIPLFYFILCFIFCLFFYLFFLLFYYMYFIKYLINKDETSLLPFKKKKKKLKTYIYLPKLVLGLMVNYQNILVLRKEFGKVVSFHLSYLTCSLMIY